MTRWLKARCLSSARYGGSALLPSVRPMIKLTDSSYTDVPKYRCPRCTTKTCSLPCYKRHQQRASCNGKRDPAAYLKKSQLATPASVDRDYNYLKDIERNIDDASVDARERGVGGHPHPQSREAQSRNFRREGAFQRYLSENGIFVEYAPKGMSRQKSNRSRVTKNDKIYWSIEWRDETGKPDLRHDAEYNSTLGELYAGVQAVRRKRKAVSESAGESDRTDGKRRKASEDASLQPRQSSERENGDALPGATTSFKPDSDTHHHHHQQRKDHYYLLKQSTSGSSCVLIPLQSTSTLTQALHGQNVQEYPTIYVLPNSPQCLPREFISVDDYRANLRIGERTAASEGRDATQFAPATRSIQAKETTSEGEVDAKAILDMLKRDVRA